MSKTMADHARAYRTRKAERIARMEARNNDLQEALGLALAMLVQNEPGDSRLVSDVFVALASVEADVMSDEAMPLIRAAKLTLS